MRKLQRPSPGPDCLDEVPANLNWQAFRGPCRTTVRESLAEMNRDLGAPLCSYCESAIPNRADGHIEHFYRQADFPGKTYAWDNLFLCCTHEDHCGHFKDKSKSPDYHPDDLIKPDVDDPGDYLHFLSSGEVRPRWGLSESDHAKAELTIAVLNLNEGTLKGRRRAVAGRAQSLILPDLEALETLTEQERVEYFAEEIAEFRRGAYSTVAGQIFTDLR